MVTFRGTIGSCNLSKYCGDSGLAQVCIYLDDILVTGKSESEHVQNLATVVERLESVGIHLKPDRCAFMLKYLGHRISAQGLQPLTSNV